MRRPIPQILRKLQGTERRQKPNEREALSRKLGSRHNQERAEFIGRQRA